MEAGRPDSIRQVLGEAVVVPDKVLSVEPQTFADRGVGQIEHLEAIDVDSPDPPQHLEGIDPSTQEVAKQFRPCGLLLVGRVPHTWTVAAVEPPFASGGISERLERPLR